MKILMLNLVVLLAAQAARVLAVPPLLDADGKEIVLPPPQRIEYGEYVPMKAACVALRRGATSAEKIGAADFRAAVERWGGPAPALVSDDADLSAYAVVLRVEVKDQVHSDFKDLSGSRRAESYVIDVTRKDAVTTVRCSGSAPRGAFYALQTLRQLLNARNGQVLLRTAQVRDWPALELRLWVKWSAGLNVKPRIGALESAEEVAAMVGAMDFLARYKLNTFGTGYWVNWAVWPDKAGAEQLRTNVGRLANHARDTGMFDYLQYAHLAARSRMDVTDPEKVQALIGFLSFALSEGASHIGVLNDDFAHFSEAEKVLYQDAGAGIGERRLADFTGMLYKEVRPKFPDATILVCPEHYHYSIGHEINALLDTHLASRLPPDVGLMWTGPRVVSGRIAREEFVQWPARLSGHKPFLWDNTIYSHWRGHIGMFALFNPYETVLPDDVPDLLFKGIHLNDVMPEFAIGKLGAVTFACYAWNPDAYKRLGPEKVMRMALEALYGAEFAGLCLEFRERFVDAMHWVQPKRKPGRETVPVDAESAARLYERLTSLIEAIRAKCPDPALLADIEKLYEDLCKRRSVKQEGK